MAAAVRYRTLRLLMQPAGGSGDVPCIVVQVVGHFPVALKSSDGVRERFIITVADNCSGGAVEVSFWGIAAEKAEAVGVDVGGDRHFARSEELQRELAAALRGRLAATVRAPLDVLLRATTSLLQESCDKLLEARLPLSFHI